MLNIEILAIEIRNHKAAAATPTMLRAGTRCTLINCEQFSGKLAAVESDGHTYLLPTEALEPRPARRAGKLKRAS